MKRTKPVRDEVSYLRRDAERDSELTCDAVKERLDAHNTSHVSCSERLQ